MNRDRDFLLDIVELIETINRHRPDTVDDSVGDEVLPTAVIHWVQTLGEAANGVSEETRSSYPDVPITSQTKSEDRSAFDLAALTGSGRLSRGHSTLLPR